MNASAKTLWLRWVAANALAELFGLGSTFAIIGWLTARVQSPGIQGILIAFVLTVLAGSLEATIVGFAQWWAMHPWFPMIERFAWWRATLIGALLGYVLGYLPSTLMSMGEAAGEAPPAEPPQWVVLLLAGALGLVAGAILSFAQWLVLRGKVSRSGSWIPANMLAWALGMPIIFQAMDWAFRMLALWQSLLVIAAMLLLAGAVVGFIHGRFLVRMVPQQNTQA
jgi:hypothetical protein